MSSHCTSCGSSVPDGQRSCSMCYGDIDHGRDGYYRAWAEEQERRAAEDAAQQQPDDESEAPR